MQTNEKTGPEYRNPSLTASTPGGTIFTRVNVYNSVW